VKSATLVDLSNKTVFRNASTPVLVEQALALGEGKLASNGTLVVNTGDRKGRSPKDKYLEDTPEIHDKIAWGSVNQPMAPDKFDMLVKIAQDHYESLDTVYQFDGFVGADTKYRLGVRAYTELAWHSLFCKTLFIEPTAKELDQFGPDWTIINCTSRLISKEEADALGVNHTGVVVAQSLTRKTILIFGTQYAGEMKKGMFYAMNFDMPEVEVFPMHCSANIDKLDDTNVALFFGLSGTGKTTLSADENRALIGDDEHGWSEDGIFNFEGGCYAKCINLSQQGEPQIWNAIRFGSVLENVVMDDQARTVDYTDNSETENTRVTYPVEFIPGAKIPSVGTHAKNVIFLTADAFGVLPPVSRLTREQAQYYFINGYTSKVAGTEVGVTEPQPNFSACFGAAFLPRPPHVYAQQLCQRMDEHDTNVWLLNTGWHGTKDGTLQRYRLRWTRSMVSAILDGTLADVHFHLDPFFGLHIPDEIPGGEVPTNILDPRNLWPDKSAYDAKAKELASLFAENDKKYEMDDDVRAAGPKGG
jgi:phosphoenolpyruvate carboxykinase (ATP)